MPKAFEVSDLTFRYPGAKEDVLHGLSFDIEQGEIYGLLGPSGAGKSTTQRILTRLLCDYRGSIRYFGTDLNLQKQAFYEEIGVGFEMPVHFGKLTGLENMQFFASFYRNKADIRALMERVGLWEYRNMRVNAYSKGMKVRLNFVRALLNQPKMLFLDEVTNGLDPVNARIIKEQIMEFKKNGGTVFLSTHLMNDVEQLCDRIAFCVEGRLIETATPRELKLKYGKREVRVEYRDHADLVTQLFSMENIGKNEAFLNLLKDKSIETIHSGETSMEDIFIKVTGAPLQ